VLVVGGFPFDIVNLDEHVSRHRNISFNPIAIGPQSDVRVTPSPAHFMGDFWLRSKPGLQVRR
jgi:hypothetical protein